MLVREVDFPIQVTPIYADPRKKSKTEVFSWVISLSKNDTNFYGTVTRKETGQKKEFPNLGLEENEAMNKLKEYCTNSSSAK
ncbi:hypothetical protein [Niallia sp. FSL W8-1348]|uniref:hypothetical protein n=1 Tax=Niallia sp. FSL W8-1348 TaxID=2954656 RepID=UPI0030FA4290